MIRLLLRASTAGALKISAKEVIFMGPDLLEVYNPWTGQIVKTTHSNLMSIIRTLNKLSRPVELWSLLYAFGLEQSAPKKGTDILADSSENLGVRTTRLNDRIVLELYVRTDL